MAGAEHEQVIACRQQMPVLRLLILVAAAAASGCDPVSLTVLGVGSAVGVQHTLSGVSYRTFTAPLPKVQSAVVSALGRMDIKIESREKTENGMLIKARASDRDIEIQLESISPNTTRMRSIARSGALMDSSTAIEIIIQTEKGPVLVKGDGI